MGAAEGALPGARRRTSWRIARICVARPPPHPGPTAPRPNRAPRQPAARPTRCPGRPPPLLPAQSTAALPFGTILIILVIWSLVTIPLTIFGGIAGKNSKAGFDAPCR